MNNLPMVDAIFNHATGDTVVAHPSKANVYVTSSHFREIIEGGHDDSACVYTTEVACVQWDYSIPSAPRGICVQTRESKTCTCP